MASSSRRRSERLGGEVATIRKERRFEDIVSDEEDEEEVIPSFLQKGKEVEKQNTKQNNKAALSSPSRRPRSTLHEQIDEDGFIFSIAGPAATKAKVPGAKGLPSAHSNVREKISEAETPVIRRNQQKRAQAEAAASEEEHFRPSGTNKRQPSDSIKRIRRTSQLHDGTPAYPHASIADGDLHNYCSADLEPHERLKHVAGWLLERRRKEIKNKLQAESAGGHRGPLLAALKATLRDLNKGAIETQRDEQQQLSSSSSTSKDASNGVPKKRRKLPAHPRNEANREKKRKLEEVVQALKQEKEAWERQRDEVNRIQEETDILARSGDPVASVEETITSLEEETQLSAEDRRRLQLVKKAFERAGINSANTPSRENDSSIEDDPRWKDVEFNADLLRSKTHTFAQFSSLSQKYNAAVSARGAKALKDMTQGPSTSLRGSARGGTSTSTISRESLDNLDQILSEIRTIPDDTKEDAERGHTVGDVSEGDILRAYAQMS